MVRLSEKMNENIEQVTSVYNAYRDKICSYVFRLTGSWEDAEDITHQTFEKAILKWDTLKDDSARKSWLFSIATNIAKDCFRARKRWTEFAKIRFKEAVISSPEIQSELMHVVNYSDYNVFEIKEHIDHCFTCIMRSLPLEEQIVLMLKDIYNFKIEECAYILTKTVGVVKHLLFNSRKTMKRIFKETCSLVNKNGICFQCEVLNKIFNSRSNTKAELNKIDLVRQSDSLKEEKLYQLRVKLVRSISPLNSSGKDIFKALMDMTSQANAD